MKLVCAAGWRDFWLLRAATWKESRLAAGCFLRHASGVSRAQPQGNAVSLDSMSSETKKAANDHVHNLSLGQLRSRWASEDIRIFKEAADAGRCATEVAKLISGRSIDSIENKLRRYRSIGDLEFPSASRQPWTLDETATLLKLRQAGVTVREMLPYFPNRSRNSILSKCWEIDGDTAERPPRPIGKRYSAVEDELLRSLAERAIPYRFVAKLLNRPIRSISSRCQKVGASSSFFWNQAKITRLSQLSMNRLSSREIGMQLGKTPTSIYNYSRRWNREADTANKIAKPARGLVRLTPERRKTIVNLRKQGCTWSDIQAQEFPGIKTNTLANAFLYHGDPTQDSDRTGLKPTLLSQLSSPVVEHIQRLRNEGRTWREIGKMTFPKFHWPHVANLARRRIVELSCEQSEQASSSESGGAS